MRLQASINTSFITSKDPFRNDRAWLFPYPLDMELLQEGARILMEYRDFTSFSKRNTQVKISSAVLKYLNGTKKAML
jgi:tRNA U38,U39,U40 pseudouridine synthase TruA